MNYRECSICGEWSWSHRHKCAPRWLAGTEDEYNEYKHGHDSLRTVYADDPKEAAEKYSEQSDRADGEFFIARYAPVKVAVIKYGELEPEVHWFEITVEMIPEYSAMKIKEKSDAPTNEVADAKAKSQISNK